MLNFKKHMLVYIGIFGFFLVSALLYRLYVSYSEEEQQNNMKTFFDYHVRQLNKNIEDAKLSSMAIAVLLGQNDGIQKCLLNSNRDECIKDIRNIVNTLSAVSMYNNIKIHLHTKDLKSYVRSWDTQRFGDTLTSFRYLINQVIKEQKPVAGIEAGVAGVYMRAVSNVAYDSQNIGSVEVLLSYEHLGNFFKEQGIDLFVLLDKNQAISHKPNTNDDLLKNHYIENLNSSNLNIIEILRDIDFSKTDFYVYKTHYFSIIPIIDAGSKSIGYYVLHINIDDKERNISQNYIQTDELF
ncbi:MAG: chemotaxis protein [Campylobacter sp.]|nr:chemotaxis protein [Campylobacter sp.]